MLIRVLLPFEPEQKQDMTAKFVKIDTLNEKADSQIDKSDAVQIDTESPAIQSIVQYLRRPIPEIKKFG